VIIAKFQSAKFIIAEQACNDEKIAKIPKISKIDFQPLKY
jgi:hypothetical protein